MTIERIKNIEDLDFDESYDTSINENKESKRRSTVTHNPNNGQYVMWLDDTDQHRTAGFTFCYDDKETAKYISDRFLFKGLTIDGLTMAVLEIQDPQAYQDEGVMVQESRIDDQGNWVDW